MTFFAVARGRLGQLREPLGLNEDIRGCIRPGTWVEVGEWFVVGARRGRGDGALGGKSRGAGGLGDTSRPAATLGQAFAGADYH